jgi:HSP20 family protein
MAISLRKSAELPAPVSSERDPFRLVRDMLGWDPFRDVMAPSWRLEPPAFVPAFEVKETKESYIFCADLPGVKEEELELRLTGNRLAILGKRMAETEEKNETIFVYERSYGAFTRTFTLPEGIDADHVRAELKEGVLRVVVPKLPEMQPRKIAIQSETVKV